MNKPIVAFGPVMPGWGSWSWIGADVAKELDKYFSTVTFSGAAVPECDVLIVVKHALPFNVIDQVSRRARIMYCPVDYYGSASHIDADAAMLRKCSRILIHSESLRKYFAPYAPVEYMDHHVKFVCPMRKSFRKTGYILWVGVRTNLPALVDWVNAHPLPCELRILTNPEDPENVPSPEMVGLKSELPVRIENWTPEKHLKLLAGARAAIDIKGTEFRSRHKPPAKAIDFIASGVPLAMNPASCVVDHLALMGFEVASPLQPERWLSKEYWQETQQFGRALRELLSLKRVGMRYRRIIQEVVSSGKAVSSQ
jgi:hypothetical protein